MSVNLLELAQGYISDAIVEKASSSLGISSELTKSGMNHVLPALLGGIMNKAGTPSGASELFNMVNRSEFGGSFLDNIGNQIGGSNSSMLDLGGNLLGSLFGNKLGGVTDLIGSAIGSKSGISSTLMKFGLPLLLGVVKRSVGKGGIKGLLGLLGGQKDYLKKAAPSGFMDKIMGSIGGGSLDDLTNNLSAQTRETVSDIKDNVEKGVEKSGNKWFKYIGIAALALLAYYLWQNYKGDATNIKENVESVVTDVKETTIKATSNIIDDANALYQSGENLVGKTIKGFENLGEFVKIKLADGTELIIPSKGLEYQLIDFIKSDKPIDKTTWFDMRRILFNTGSADLDDRSMEQIKNLEEILRVNPNVKIKIGGYTDNTGDAAINKTLSANRATAVMKELIKQGIDPNRLSAEGFGVEHPIADNNTAAGRALNRRVAVRVTNK